MPVVIPRRLRGPGQEIHSPTIDVRTHKLFIGKLQKAVVQQHNL